MKRIRNTAVLTALVSSFSSGALMAAFSSGALMAAEDAQDATPSYRADRSAAAWEEGVSREKFIKRANRHFDEMDANADGKLSRGEARERGRKQRDARDERRQQARKDRDSMPPHWMQDGDYTQKEHPKRPRPIGEQPASKE